MISSFTALESPYLDSELLQQLEKVVVEVEATLAKEVDSQVSLVAKIGRHTLDAGGKRLRPAFVSLAAKAAGSDYHHERAIGLGACMEMIHMATLIHDDVIDNAAIRRGRETASVVYGNTGAILSGDVLLAKAMVILAKDGDLDIIRAVSQSVVEMAEGEVRELELRGLFDVSEEEHLEVLRMKTASFIECCCEVGSLLASAPIHTRRALKSYGYHVGMAFQIVDDLLDYQGDNSKTGKPKATDFREGCATLPLIFLASSLSDAEKSMAARKFGNGVTDDEIRMIVDWMSTRGAFAKAQQSAAAHVAEALESLERLPKTPARDLLATVANFVIAREA